MRVVVGDVSITITEIVAVSLNSVLISIRSGRVTVRPGISLTWVPRAVLVSRICCVIFKAQTCVVFLATLITVWFNAVEAVVAGRETLPATVAVSYDFSAAV